MPEPKHNWLKDITSDVLTQLGTKAPVPPGSVGVGEGVPLPALPAETGGVDVLAEAERLRRQK
jgi:hypothetical protein